MLNHGLSHAARRSMFVFLAREVVHQGKQALRSARRAHVRHELAIDDECRYAFYPIPQHELIGSLQCGLHGEGLTGFFERVFGYSELLQESSLKTQRAFGIVWISCDQGIVVGVDLLEDFAM